MTYRENPANIRGMGSLFGALNPGIDFENFENSMKKSSKTQNRQLDNIDDEIKKVSKEYGIDDLLSTSSKHKRSSRSSSGSDYTSSYEYDTSYESGSSSRSSSSRRRHKSIKTLLTASNKNTLGDSLRDDVINFTLEKDQQDELRALRLDQIAAMRESLLDDGIDCSKIPEVTSDSDDVLIESVHRLLNIRSDRAKYSTFAEEFILTGVMGLETLFDGQNIYFGKYRPDLTGWNQSVLAKIKKVRPEMGALVGSVMREYQISPWFRIMFELVPSALLHMRLQAQKNTKTDISNDPVFQDALNKMNSYD